MFNNKKQSDAVVKLSFILEKSLCVFTSNYTTSNSVSIRVPKSDHLPPLSLLSDFSLMCAVELTGTKNLLRNTTDTHNLWYIHKYDLYVNHILTTYTLKSNSPTFFNRVWLEREVSEFFQVNFYNLADTRPLLLNYGDQINFLSKTVQLQSTFKYVTNWHARKLMRVASETIEL